MKIELAAEQDGIFYLNLYQVTILDQLELIQILTETNIDKSFWPSFDPLTAWYNVARPETIAVPEGLADVTVVDQSGETMNGVEFYKIINDLIRNGYSLLVRGGLNETEAMKIAPMGLLTDATWTIPIELFKLITSTTSCWHLANKKAIELLLAFQSIPEVETKPVCVDSECPSQLVQINEAMQAGRIEGSACPRAVDRYSDMNPSEVYKLTILETRVWKCREEKRDPNKLEF